MSWKHLVAYVKRDPEGATYLHAAGELARRFQARLTGVFGLPDLALMRGTLDRLPDSTLARRFVTEAYESAELYESRFRRQMSAAGVECDWRSAEGDPAQVMTLASRVADLAIVEQFHSETDESAWLVPEEVALNGGSPTLVVPHSCSEPSIGRRVLIAWNGSREAAQAIGAAMPLIDRAEALVVLSGESKERFATVTRRPHLSIEHRLRAHCKSVELIDFQPAFGLEGEGILSAAQSHGCDIVVMGAYGHSRIREALLGGATRHVLRHAQLPVLFSH